MLSGGSLSSLRKASAAHRQDNRNTVQTAHSMEKVKHVELSDEEETEEALLMVLAPCVGQFNEYRMQQLAPLNVTRSLLGGERQESESDENPNKKRTRVVRARPNLLYLSVG